MPWNSAANSNTTIRAVVRLLASDRVANHECLDMCRKLKRFLQSRRRSAELMRVLRRAGPNTHESKHFLKSCSSEFNVHEVNRFLERNGLDVAMTVFLKARLYERRSGLRRTEHI